MNSGDATDQMIRLTIDGVEVVVKLTGAAAKQIAAILFALTKHLINTPKTKGKARLNSMLKSGKALDIFSVKRSDLETFAKEAKRYGIVYSVISKKAPNEMCDIMVKAEDASRINRIVENNNLGTVKRAEAKTEVTLEKTTHSEAEKPVEPEAPDKNDTGKLVDELVPSDEGKAKPESDKAVQKEETHQNPNTAKTAKTRPSEPTFESNSKSARGASEKNPSMKKELRKITVEKKKREAAAPLRDEQRTPDKPRSQAGKPTIHKQPKSTGKSRPSKTKAKGR